MSTYPFPAKLWVEAVPEGPDPEDGVDEYRVYFTRTGYGVLMDGRTTEIAVYVPEEEAQEQLQALRVKMSTALDRAWDLLKMWQDGKQSPVLAEELFSKLADAIRDLPPTK